MSKVIHLGDSAHKTAKKFCKQHGLRMSDWVATLVNEAITNGAAPIDDLPVAAKKKVLAKLSSTPQANESPPWEQAPFWKKKRRARN